VVDDESLPRQPLPGTAAQPEEMGGGGGGRSARCLETWGWGAMNDGVGGDLSPAARDGGHGWSGGCSGPLGSGMNA
jgi:hypothetical protein